MKEKKKGDFERIRWWEKQLRAPLSFLFLAIYTLVVWAVWGDAKPVAPTENAPIVLCSNQADDDLKATLKEAILNAKSSIVMLMFSLTDNDILQALKQKAEEGVQVTIIHDAVATQDIAFKVGPKVTLRPRREKGLMHDKIISIDHEQVWLGSANCTKESLTVHANLMLGIHSKVFSQAIEEKAQAMLIRKNYRTAPVITKTKDQTIEWWFFPDDPKGLERLKDLLKTANKTIKVAMFTFTQPDLIHTLIDAHKRGVTVTVVLDEESSKRTSNKAFLQLKKAGLRVYVSARTGLLHHKMVIIDDNTLGVGSANWTKAAFFSNDDNLCFLFDLTDGQKRKLDLLWKTTMKEAKPSFTSQGRR